MQIEITPEYLFSQGLRKDFPERFWERVFFITYDRGCWIWIGSKGPHGYGRIGNGIRPFHRIPAHVASWIINRGPIPQGLCVLHHCDNRLCVRPDHLWLGTRRDNAEDRDAKKRLPCGENAGNAKLKQSQVDAIRFTDCTQIELANRFDVHQSTISRIRNFKRWNTHLRS